MGFYHYTQGQDDSALFYYRQALARGGSSAELHHRMASAFLLKKDFTQAQYHLQKALSLDSLNPAYWVTYGLWAHQQRQHPLAETYWKKSPRHRLHGRQSARLALRSLPRDLQ
jgi:tetratricopeptide (TPR) repeat protein